MLKPGHVPQLPTSGVQQVQLLGQGSCAAFNPYPRMGGPSASDPAVPPSWPRGFPLDRIRSPCPHRLVPTNLSRVAVLQSLADHDPDVDAIYRLTRGVPFSFRADNMQPLVLPQGSLTPWNAQATLVLKPALWTLLLPVTVHGRVSDIWRSYVSQRLLWDIGYNIAFAPPIVIQHRPAHDVLADMQAEEDLYSKAGQLVHFLRQWKGSAPTIAGRYEEVMIELYERGYVEKQDVALAQAWLVALNQGGYQFPGLISPTAGQEQAPQQQHRHVDVGSAANRTAAASSAWAVVLSRSRSPTPSVKKLASLPGWRVVVVADPGTALYEGQASSSSKQAWQLPQLTYLDEQEQSQLPFSVLKHLPWKGSSRKVLGYLYAISQGATAIYDADEAVELLQDNIPVLSCNQTSPELLPAHPSNLATPCQGILTQLKTGPSAAMLFNPYPLFGQPHVCPRGIAPARVLQGTNFSECFERGTARPVIQQGLINGRPDVDASYHGNHPLDIVFARSGFSVVMPHGVAMPLNSLNTLYLQEAMWALLLPVSHCTGNGDICRGLWSQRLLVDIGAHAVVLPPTAVRQGDALAAAYSDMQQDPVRQSASAERLWRDLLATKFQTTDLPSRMLEAATMMADRGYLQPADVALMQAWTADMQNLGYAFPKLKALTGRQDGQGVKPAVATGNSSDYLPASAWMTDGPLDNVFVFPKQWCTRLDTVLVVNFNGIGDPVLRKQIRLLHAAYRPYVGRVLVSGSEAGHWVAPGPRMQQLMDQGYVLNCGNHTIRAGNVGFFTYACAAEGAYAAQQSVWRPDGGVEAANMFYINDDVAFSPCMAERLNHSNIWYPLTDEVNINNLTGWFWNDPSSERPFPTLKQALELALQNAWGDLAPLAAKHLNPTRGHMHQQGDMFYVPARYMRMFVRVAAHFQSYWIGSEAAIVNMLGILVDEPSDVELSAFAMAWDGARDCVVSRIDEVLPLVADINHTVVRACGATMLGTSEHDKLSGLFALHPVKLGDAHVGNRWLTWWLSQQCTEQ